jgi:HemY protein
MRLWSFIFILAVATVLGVLIRQDPGYAFFAYGNWTIEMPLWVSGLFICVIITLIMLALSAYNTVVSSPKQIKLWWGKRKEYKARLQTYRGLLELTEGHWPQAERYLIRGIAHNETPLINYLSAAQAAEELGATERRDQYLAKALALNTHSEMAIRMTQAQLQLQHGELEQALKNAQSLQKEAPKHPKLLKLLCRIYQTMNNWQALFELLPMLRKLQVLPIHELLSLEQQIYPNLLPIYAGKSPKALIDFWEKMPNFLQTDLPLIFNYVILLLQHKAEEVAEYMVRKTLKNTCNNDLIRLYGLINSRPKKQLTFAETLLTEQFNNPTLLLTLGRLCLRNQLWGKARSYFEQSLAIKPLAETYAELGQLMGQLGQSEKRDEYFQKGLLSAAQTTSTYLQPLSTLQLLSYEDKQE